MKYTRGDSIVGFEKLNFLQKRHASRYASQSAEPTNPLHSLTNLAVKPVVALLDQRLANTDLPVYGSIQEGQAREAYIHSIIYADAQNYLNPTDFVQRNIYFFLPPTATDLSKSIPTFKLHKVPPGIPYIPAPETIMLFQSLFQLPDEEWSSESIRERISWVIEQGVNLSIAASNKEQGRVEIRRTEEMEKVVRKAWGKLVHGYLRWAIAAGLPGPDGAEMMGILGRQETVGRLSFAEGILKDSWAKNEVRDKEIERGETVVESRFEEVK